MRAWLGVFLLLVWLAPVAGAQSSARTDAEVFFQAETSFRQGVENKSRVLQARKHFSNASDAYRELHNRGVRSPVLYLNLGNAALLADRWPDAIWAYQLGLALDPNDARMRDQLAFVRTKVLYPPAGQGRLDADTWPGWLHRPTTYEFFCISGLSYLLACVAGTGAFLSRKSWLTLLTFGLLIILTGACVGIWHNQNQADFDRETPVVVLLDNTEFYRGNGTSYPKHPVLPLLPRGLEVRQLHHRGAWLQVRLSTGEVGWLPRDRVLIVEPCIE